MCTNVRPEETTVPVRLRRRRRQQRRQRRPVARRQSLAGALNLIFMPKIIITSAGIIARTRAWVRIFPSTARACVRACVRHARTSACYTYITA